MYVNFLSTYSDKKSCHTSTTLQTSIAQFVSYSWASCFSWQHDFFVLQYICIDFCFTIDNTIQFRQLSADICFEACKILRCIVIGAVHYTAPIKIRYVEFTFSQTEKPATLLKLT